MSSISAGRLSLKEEAPVGRVQVMLSVSGSGRAGLDEGFVMGGNVICGRVSAGFEVSLGRVVGVTASSLAVHPAIKMSNIATRRKRELDIIVTSFVYLDI
jgi:hypothetical protein